MPAVPLPVKQVAVDRAGEQDVAAQHDDVAGHVAADRDVAAGDEDALDGVAAGDVDVARGDDDRVAVPVLAGSGGRRPGRSGEQRHEGEQRRCGRESAEHSGSLTAR